MPLCSRGAWIGAITRSICALFSSSATESSCFSTSRRSTCRFKFPQESIKSKTTCKALVAYGRKQKKNKNSVAKGASEWVVSALPLPFASSSSLWRANSSSSSTRRFSNSSCSLSSTSAWKRRQRDETNVSQKVANVRANHRWKEPRI